MFEKRNKTKAQKRGEKNLQVRIQSGIMTRYGGARLLETSRVESSYCLRKALISAGSVR